MKRRVRPTFLLKLVVLGACVALWLAAFTLLTSTYIRIGTIVALLVLWVFGLELGLLPELIERRISSAYGRREGAIESIWVMDVAADEIREREKLHEALNDNPTLR